MGERTENERGKDGELRKRRRNLGKREELVVTLEVLWSSVLTCDSIGGDRAMAFPPRDAVEVELISSGGCQARDNDRAGSPIYRQGLGPPLHILVLNSEGIKLSLWDGPREMDGVMGDVGDQELP